MPISVAATEMTVLHTSHGMLVVVVVSTTIPPFEMIPHYTIERRLDSNELEEFLVRASV